MCQATDIDGGILGNVSPKLHAAVTGIRELQSDIVLGHICIGTTKDCIEDHLLQIVSVILIVNTVDNSLILFQS